MISTYKKFWSRLKNKVCPALLSICLISCIASPFASAAEYNGDGYVQFSQYRTNGTVSQIVSNMSTTESLPFVGVILNGQSDGNATYKYATYSLNTVSIPDAVFTSAVSVYFSCFSAFPVNVTHYRAPWLVSPRPTFNLTYVDPDTGVTSTSEQVGISTFIPESPQDASDYGILLDARIEPSELQSASQLSINGTGNLFMWDNSVGYPNAPYIQVVSFRVVAADSSATLDGLEAIADQIVGQSEMMEAFYGDIVAICNQIYSRLGDIEATAELANVYFQQMIELLKHIDSTTSNIYNLLPTQFAMLETAINTASTNIVAAVQAQTNALIAYFDSVFSGAVGQLPEKSDDLETEIGNVGNAESEYKSNASATFEQLSADFTGFTGGTLSGIALASNLFTQVWNALGEYSVVYSFPLLLGLCLLLIGRLSKYSGGQSSTDKERGDSDA